MSCVLALHASPRSLLVQQHSTDALAAVLLQVSSGHRARQGRTTAGGHKSSAAAAREAAVQDKIAYASAALDIFGDVNLNPYAYDASP